MSDRILDKNPDTSQFYQTRIHVRLCFRTTQQKIIKVESLILRYIFIVVSVA